MLKNTNWADCLQKPKWGIGEQNEGIAENKGGNARNEMGMWVQRISVGMWGIWVEIWKILGIRVAMHGIKVEIKYSGRNDME